MFYLNPIFVIFAEVCVTSVPRKSNLGRL